MRVETNLPCMQCPFERDCPRCKGAFYEANGFYCDKIPVTINTPDYEEIG